jgi:hypothetical protein
MNNRWAVNAHPNTELETSKQFDPFAVDGRPICLQTIANGLTGTGEPSLKKQEPKEANLTN